jgi:hypothetical protein
MNKPTQYDGAMLAADRVSGPPRANSDQVAIEFDWEVPASASDPVVFQVRINRGDRASLVRCAINLNQLQPGDLQILRDFLANRPTGHWLVDASFRRMQPHWSTEHRNRKVRELLLAVANN